jgi:hypothetical protein
MALSHALTNTGRLCPGKLISNGTFVIIDDGKFIRTQCYVGEDIEARKRLTEYMINKYEPTRRERDIESIDVADVLSVYLDDCRDGQANKAKLDERLERLTKWWGGKMLSEVTAKACRDYARKRELRPCERISLGDGRPHHFGADVGKTTSASLVGYQTTPRRSARSRWRRSIAKVKCCSQSNG